MIYWLRINEKSKYIPVTISENVSAVEQRDLACLDYEETILTKTILTKTEKTETSAMENVNNKLIKYKVRDIFSHDQSLKEVVCYVIIV